jgi:hypothetical protein
LSLGQKEQIKNYLESSKTDYPWLNLKVQEVIDFMMNNSVDLKNPNELSVRTKIIDELRNESFDKTFPELSKILKI